MIYNNPEAGMKEHHGALGAMPVPSQTPRFDATAKGVELLQTLQTTLDLEQMIGLFSNVILEAIPHEGYRFRHEGLSLDFSEGRQSRHQASYNLALTYENRGNLDSAIYYYKKTISIKPKLSQAHMRLGKIYEKQKRYNEALREFEEVVKIDPSYFASHPQLGEEYRNVNIIEFVLQKYQARLSRNPRDAEALGVVGRIYFQLGRLGQAEQYFQQLVQLKPNDQLAQETLREIRKRLRKL